MYFLLEFIRKYYYVLLFLVLEGVSFLLLFRFNNYQGSVWFSAANSAVAEVNRRYSDVMSYLDLKEVNRHLTDENLRLQLEADRLREALYETARDTSHTERVVRRLLENYRLVSAEVVSNSKERADNYLVIDRGTADGVAPEMGVVGGGGAVGIVYLAGPHHSLVIPLTNKKSSVSCRVRGQRYFGYLQWDGQNMHVASLDDIPRYARVKVGDVVETSGYSAVFPPGIFVGRIAGIGNSADGQSYRLTVNLGTDFSNIRDVNVIITPYKAEIDTLRATAQKELPPAEGM